MPSGVSMPAAGASLVEIQRYVRQVIVERGFGDQPIEQTMLLLTEEVGELAKALRKHAGMGFSHTTTRREAEEEIADVLIVTLSIANTLGIDAEAAIYAKEEKNRERSWQKE